MNLDPKAIDVLEPRFGSYINATYDCIGTLEGKPNNRKVYACLGELEKDKEAGKKR